MKERDEITASRLDARWLAETQRVCDLAAANPARLCIVHADTAYIDYHLHCPSVFESVADGEPEVRAAWHELRITRSPGWPRIPPTLRYLWPQGIFNPHIASLPRHPQRRDDADMVLRILAILADPGVVCFGDAAVGMTLDWVIQRSYSILTYSDAVASDGEGHLNPEAAAWALRMKSRKPGCFPLAHGILAFGGTP